MKRIFRWTYIMAALFTALLVLTGAVANPEVKTVKVLIETRAVIMENVLRGNITEEEGVSKLSDIEDGYLLKKDTNALESCQYIDYEPLKELKILSVIKKSEIYDKKLFEAKIRWTYSDYEGIHNDERIYTVGVSEKNGKMKLISFETK